MPFRLGPPARPQGWTRSERLQWVLYRSAKSDPARRFHALYGHLARSEVLWRAWVSVRANQGAAGCRRVPIARCRGSGVTEFLHEIAAAVAGRILSSVRLSAGDDPQAGQPGESRPLGIPTVADRVVMAAAKLVLEPIFEAGFSPRATGSGPTVRVSMPAKLSASRRTGAGTGCWRPICGTVSARSTMTR